MPGWAQRLPALGRLQATTLALRLGRGLGRGAGSDREGWRPPPTVADVAARRRADLPGELRTRYDALRTDAVRASGAADVLERAFAAGAPLGAIEPLARLWPELTDRDRDQVAAPLRPGHGARQLRLGDAPARQTDETTCGSAVLAMLAAAGDPLLALWLVTGRSPAGYRPREVRALGPAELAAPDAAARFAAVQRAIKTRTNRAALGPLAWPARLGTPPWGAARVARHPGVTFQAIMVDDTDADGFGALLDRVERALAAGVAVPLFTGGDLASGLTTAMPRHVVLLTPRVDPRRAVAGPGETRGRFTVFEPAGGAVHDLTRAELLAPAGARAALGGWSHVCWAVLPGA